jgi:hypothetical protein
MTQIIPNTQAVPQVIGGSPVVINGSNYNWIPSEIMRGVKVIHVGDYSFSAEETGGGTAELKMTLQRDIGSGWEDQPGEVSGLTFTVGQDRRFRVLCKVPYYDGIEAGILPKYRLLAECLTGQVTMHSAEGQEGVPSGQWKSEYEFEGEEPVVIPIEIWTERTLDESLNYTGAVNHNGRIIACSRTGTGNRIATSDDGGATWVQRASAGDHNWRRLATNGAIVVCIATGGEIQTSADGGITWVLQSPPREAGLNDICYTGTAFIAVSGNQSFAEQVYRSTDGGNWSLIDNGNVGGWYCCASDGAGKAVMLSTAGEAQYSGNHGLTWATVTIDDHSWQSVTHDGLQFIAVADSGYTAIGPGVSWSTGQQLSLTYPEHIYHAHGQTVICASDKSGSDVAVTVDGGDNWTYNTTPTSAFWNCLASNDDRFVCVGNIGVMTAEIA